LVVGGHENDTHVHVQQREQVHPGLAGELDVEEHHVGIVGAYESRGLGNGAGLADDVYRPGVRLLDQSPQLAAGEALVVHDDRVTPAPAPAGAGLRKRAGSSTTPLTRPFVWLMSIR